MINYLRAHIKLKSILISLTAAFVILLSLTVLSSCNGKFDDKSYEKDEDYIEVQSLRINKGSANIFMSSYGDPSTYQLDIRTVPADATNRKLNYYISSEYHQYVTVDSSGLLTAHKETGDAKVNLTVRSTTNPNAYLTIAIVVEDVTVSSVGFVQERVALLYNGESEQLGVTFTPAHAIVGRTVVFSSFDESICKVDSNGVITPVGAGYTAVKASCRLSSTKSISKLIEVQVSYAKGQYQLVASGNPQYEQVIGDYIPIDFTLLTLGNNVDPNPQISWYVDTERVASNEDRVQYTHIPSATTQLTYYIYARIRPYQGEAVELKSEPIRIYKAFNGISLTYDNLSSVYEPHTYGETVTFNIGMGDSSSTIMSYEWVLSEIARPNVSAVVGTTYPSNKNLTRRINIAGDYTLTAVGLDSRGNTVNKTQFPFSAEKYVEGDTLVARPAPLEYGLPPDSYHWYAVPCDDEGNYDPSQKVPIADTPTDSALYYPLKAGKLRLLVTASINGVAATVKIHGESVPYEYVSDVIRVYPTFYTDEIVEGNLIDPSVTEQRAFAVYDYAEVTDIKIEGIGRSDYRVFIQWNNIENASAFIVELTFDDGSVIICDSENKTTGNTFGSNFVYLSEDCATLSDVFSVRIKQKRGLFSQRFYYGTPNDKGVSDETHILTYNAEVYPFFETIGLNNTTQEYTPALASIMNAPALNAYIYDMSDLRDIVTFILLLRPSANSYIKKGTAISNGLLCDTYTLDLYVPFRLTDTEKAKYPHPLTEEELDSFGPYAYLAELIYGAVYSLPFGFDFTLAFEEVDIGARVIFFVPATQNLELKSTTSIAAKPTKSRVYTVNDVESVNISGLPVDSKDPINVRTSEDLLYAIEHGYKPVPVGSNALANLYTRIKETVAGITADNMTEREKALAFADYLALNVTIDRQIEELAASNELTYYSLFLYKAYRLEGVFSGRLANDVGIAKAFTVMCGIVGIPCHTVIADINGGIHAFNKVRCNGVWYVVDIYYGMRIIDGYSVTSTNAIMISDTEYARLYGGIDSVTVYGDMPIATGTANKAYPLITTDNDLRAELNDLVSLDAGMYGIELDFSRNVYVDADAIKESIAAVRVGHISLSENFEVVYTDKNIIRVVVLATIII